TLDGDILVSPLDKRTHLVRVADSRQYVPVLIGGLVYNRDLLEIGPTLERLEDPVRLDGFVIRALPAELDASHSPHCSKPDRRRRSADRNELLKPLIPRVGNDETAPAQNRYRRRFYEISL